MSNAPKLILGNWKSNKNLDQTQTWLKEVYQAAGLPTGSQATVALAPAFPLIAAVAEFVKTQTAMTVDFKLNVAAQDLSPFPPGKYTGEVAAESLQDFNVKFVIVGHSERRRYFHETHQEVANKAEQAVHHGMTPVICVDEEYVQVQAAALMPEVIKKCVVAYEPLAAIGSGNSQPVAEVLPVLQMIKESFGDVQVIYGGSVNADQVSEYLTVLDGVLVGTHSLEAANFIKLLKAIS
jgi:triosephosphate isomerase (TIM)